MADVSIDWTCPYCNKPTVITAPLFGQSTQYIGTDRSKYGDVNLRWTAFACPNKECRELTIHAHIYTYKWDGNQNKQTGTVFSERLLPESSAKSYPDYIPQEIRSTYIEACRIANLSPKASATLSRRCLQGMIRDFWDVKGKPTLFQEINAIKDKVAPDTWDAIDGVRKIGNIGAHMEKDVNLIVDVEPNEAEILIQLTETLFEDWYIERHKRSQRNAAIKEMAEKKKKPAD